MTKNQKQINNLNKDLIKLQTHSHVVTCDSRNVDKNKYIHLCNVYFWWRFASQVHGYLERQYKKFKIQYKKNANYTLNFSPVIRLAFGHNTLDDSWINRYSHALKAVHQEYESKTELYAKNGVIKLANFIELSGGIDKLIGYAPSDESYDPDNTDGNSKKLKANSSRDIQKTEQMLLALSWIFEGYSQKYLIDPPPYFKSTLTKYSLLLVQHTNDGLNLVDSLNDSKLVDKLLAENLKRRFELTPVAIRTLFEIIQTQCLPKHLEPIVNSLIDKTRLPNEKKSFKSHRRVLYRSESDEFILSPMNAMSGVVSVVRPYFKLLLEGCEHDVFLNVSDREDIERKLLRNFEFNFYNLEFKTETIPKYPEENSASHVVHLTHRIKLNEYITLSFWPFYRSMQFPQDQIIIDPEYVLEPSWYALIGHNEIKRVYDIFVDKWLTNIGPHLTRNKHALIKITFTKDKLFFEFVYQNNQFEHLQAVNINMLQASDQSITACFASKDLMPVLKSLNDLPITVAVVEDPTLNSEYVKGSFIPEEAANYKGGVWFELDENLLRIEFCTVYIGGGGGEYTINIPTVDLEGNRAAKPFVRYHPEITDDPITQEEDEQQFHEILPVTFQN